MSKKRIAVLNYTGNKLPKKALNGRIFAISAEELGFTRTIGNILRHDPDLVEVYADIETYEIVRQSLNSAGIETLRVTQQ